MVADTFNNRVRRLLARASTSSPSSRPVPEMSAASELEAEEDGHFLLELGRTVSTLAGSGTSGFANGARAAAKFNGLEALAPLPDGAAPRRVL